MPLKEIASIVAWPALLCSFVYMLEPIWRMSYHRPGHWGPLYGEFLMLLPFLLVAAGNSGPAITSALLAGSSIATTVLRLVARKRFGIPARPRT